MLIISGALLTFHHKTDVCTILIVTTNITHAFDIYTSIMFSVSQCFKYGFDFIYFPKFSVREGKCICYMLTDQKKQRKSLHIIGNPCFEGMDLQLLSAMLWSPASLKLLLFNDNISLPWGYTTNNYGIFWSLHCVLLLLKDSILRPFFAYNLLVFKTMSKYPPFWKLLAYAMACLWSFSAVIIYCMTSLSLQSNCWLPLHWQSQRSLC